MTRLFLALSVILIALVGVAAAKDSHDRQYLSVQDQYRGDYYGSNGLDKATGKLKVFDDQVQEVVPAFSQGAVGQTLRSERCISCHVPDLKAVGPQEAAKRLVQDFLKYEPNHDQIAKADGLKLQHPAVVTQQYYDQWGADSFATSDGFHPYLVTGAGDTTAHAVQLAGPLPSLLAPSANGGKALGIDQTGCIVCHNGSRLALDQTAAHENLIVNPEYSFTAGAALYYKLCVQCHGDLGEGKIGPPLSNQDRLGFFNEDYYYRCIEYGYTDFEHVGSKMPAWGSAAPDWTYDSERDKGSATVTRTLSEDQIHTLVQFIRHWENYTTLP